MISDLLDKRILLGVEERDYSYILEAYRQICRTFNVFNNKTPLLELAQVSQDPILYTIFSVDSQLDYSKHIRDLANFDVGDKSENKTETLEFVSLYGKYKGFYSHISPENAVGDIFLSYFCEDTSNPEMQSLIASLARTSSMSSLIHISESIIFENVTHFIVDTLKLNLLKFLDKLNKQLPNLFKISFELSNNLSMSRADVLRSLLRSNLMEKCTELDISGINLTPGELRFLLYCKNFSSPVKHMEKLDVSSNGLLCNKYDSITFPKNFRDTTLKVVDLYIEEPKNKFSFSILDTVLGEQFFMENVSNLHISERDLPKSTHVLLDKTSINKVFCFGEVIYRK